MFATIEAAILQVLRDHLTTVPPDTIRASRSRGGRVPAVTLVNVDFVVKEVGFGRSGGGVELEDTFQGDGATVAFGLRVKPLRPILAVEAPPGTRVPVDDYAVDYEQGLVTFHAPPLAADAIVVRYLKPTQVKGVKLDLRYHLTVWGADEVERDTLTVAAMEALLREEEALARQGVFLTPVKGFTVPPTGEEGSDDGYGRTLEYRVEASLEVEVPLPRIEKIEIHRE